MYIEIITLLCARSPLIWNRHVYMYVKCKTGRIDFMYIGDPLGKILQGQKFYSERRFLWWEERAEGRKPPDPLITMSGGMDTRLQCDWLQLIRAELNTNTIWTESAQRINRQQYWGMWYRQSRWSPACCTIPWWNHLVILLFAPFPLLHISFVPTASFPATSFHQLPRGHLLSLIPLLGLQ